MLLLFSELFRPGDPFYNERFIFRAEKGPSLQRIKVYGEKFDAKPDQEETPEEPEKSKKKEEEKKLLEETKEEKPESEPPIKLKPKEAAEGKEKKETAEQQRQKRIETERVKQKAQQGLEAIHRNLELMGVFKNKAERLKYVGRIREAIETLRPDRLYEFVKTHQKYKGDYRQWNREFCELLGEDDLSPAEQRKYVAGLQAFLTGRFTEADPPVVFELREGNRINRFTYVDGMLGGYTVSVLGAYLTSDLYQKRNKEWETPYANLDLEFAKKGRRKKEFGKAIQHLKSQLADEEPAEPQKKSTEEVAEDKEAAEGKEAEKREGEEQFPAKKLAELNELDDHKKEGVKAIIQDIFHIDRYKKRLDEKREVLDDDIAVFLKKGAHMGTWDDIDVIDREYTREGSWPRKAYGRYVAAYDAWKNYRNKYNNEIRDNPMSSNKYKREAFSKLKKFADKKDRTFEDLKVAIDAYYDEELKNEQKVKEHIKKRLAAEALKYDFPSDIDLAHFHIRNHPAHEKVQTMKRSLPLLPASMRSYPRPRDYKEFLEYYFTRIPTKPFSSNDEVRTSEYLKAKTDKIDFPRKLGMVFRGQEEKLYQYINTMIYLNNLDAFNRSRLRIIHKERWNMKKQLKAEMDKESLDNMLSRVRKESSSRLASAEG